MQTINPFTDYALKKTFGSTASEGVLLLFMEI